VTALVGWAIYAACMLVLPPVLRFGRWLCAHLAA
jgi:hypothetical protein